MSHLFGFDTLSGDAARGIRGECIKQEEKERAAVGEGRCRFVGRCALIKTLLASSAEAKSQSPLFLCRPRITQ
jgi:hypothetical protein